MKSLYYLPDYFVLLSEYSGLEYLTLSDELNLALYKYLKYEFNGTEKQKLELLDEFSKLQDSIDDAGYAAGYVDSFWKKYADKLGVSYKTNFLNPD